MSDFGLQVAIADTVKELLGDTLEHRKSTAAAISPDGRVVPEAVAGALPWQAHGGRVEGAVTVGSSVLRWHFPQGGVIRQVSYDARTAPNGSGLLFTLSGGNTTESFSLQSGQTNGVTSTNIVMAPGSWARLNVTAANGAADLAVALQYESAGSGSTSSGGIGGGGGSGGGTISVISVNGQTGVVQLNADDIDDTSTTHKFVSAADRTKLQSFDPGLYALASSLSLVAISGDYDDLANTPTIPSQINPIAGANMSITGTYPDITFSTSGGGAGSVDSVNGQAGIVVLDADDIDDASTTHKFATQAQLTKLNGIEAGAEMNVQSDWDAASGDASILNKPATFPPSPHDHDERYYTRAEVDALVNQAETQSGVWHGSSPTNTTDISGTYSNMLVLQSVSLDTVIPEITNGTWDVDISAHALVYRSVATGGIRLKIGDGTNQWAVGALGRNFPQSNGYTMNTYAAMKSVPHNATLDLRLSGFQTAGTTHCVDYGWKITARRVG